MSIWSDDCRTAQEVRVRAKLALEKRRQMFNATPRPVVDAEPEPVVETLAPPPIVAKPATKPATKPRRIFLSEIMRATCDHFHITEDEFLSTRRVNPLPTARQVAMYLGCENTKLSLPRIGWALRRDHTTVMHARAKIGKMLKDRHDKASEMIAEAVETIMAAILSLEVTDQSVEMPTEPERRHRNSWSEEEERRLLQLRAEGKKRGDIAQAMDRSKESIMRKLSRLRKHSEAAA